MDDATKTNQNPFSLDPAELRRRLVALMTEGDRKYQFPLWILQVNQGMIARISEPLRPYQAEVCPYVDKALETLLDGQPAPATWLGVTKMLMNPNYLGPAFVASHLALGDLGKIEDVLNEASKAAEYEGASKQG